MFRMPFRISNRFGEPLDGALLDVELSLGPAGQRPTGHARANAEGIGEMSINVGRMRPYGAMRGSYRVQWTDPEGVLWGFGGETEWPVTLTPERNHLTTTARIGFTITTRAFPQGLPLPEIRHATRTRIDAMPDGSALLHTYDGCRDAIIAGLPDASAVLAGKTLETALILRGRAKGWPLVEWLKRKPALMIGDYLHEEMVKSDLVSSFSPGFYKHMLGANDWRILGAHQLFERVDMPNAKAVQSNLTKLLDGWFSGGAQE